MDEQARVLPFVPLDRERLNRQLDEEILDRERADEVAAIADRKLDELEVERIIKGEVNPF